MSRKSRNLFDKTKIIQCEYTPIQRVGITIEQYKEYRGLKQELDNKNDKIEELEKEITDREISYMNLCNDYNYYKDYIKSSKERSYNYIKQLEDQNKMFLQKYVEEYKLEVKPIMIDLNQLNENIVKDLFNNHKRFGEQNGPI